MGIFMAGFWIVISLILILYLVNLKVKYKNIENLIGFLVLFQLMLFIIAIATNDPFFEQFGVPTPWELIGEGLVACFTIWRYYLTPMKNRIGELEIKNGKFESEISNIKEDLKWIKNFLMNSNKQTFQ